MFCLVETVLIDFINIKSRNSKWLLITIDTNYYMYFVFLKYTNSIPPFKGTIDELFLTVSVALKSVTDHTYMAACLAVH